METKSHMNTRYHEISSKFSFLPIPVPISSWASVQRLISADKCKLHL